MGYSYLEDEQNKVSCSIWTSKNL